MSLQTESRKQLIDEIADALEQNYDSFEHFYYVDVTNSSVGISEDDEITVGELFPKDG